MSPPTWCWQVVLCSAAVSGLTAPLSPKPHIAVILADDLGWANVGWNRAVPDPEVVTPTLDALVRNGIELTQFYTFKYCSPTRSALQSGRNPIHVNVDNGDPTCHNPADPIAGYSGIPVAMTTLPAKMRQAGYVPHAVGKWHVGMAVEAQTPAGRGYETWLGYFSACNDYWNNQPMCGGSMCGNTPMVDLWEQNRSAPGSQGPTSYLSQPALGINNSATCSQQHQEGCLFEDDLFERRVADIIEHHAAMAPVSSPLFLFWAPHAVHGPREVPQPTLDKFQFIDWVPRRTYHALVAYLDGAVGRAQSLLETKGMWNNTLVIFSSDNGGDDQANNYPLRGAKFSNWQGGVHVAAFVSGGYLPPHRRGIQLHGLATVWDILATSAVVGGLDVANATADPIASEAGLPPMDSISQWGYWSGVESSPPRTMVAIGGEVGNENGGPSGVRFTGPTATNTGVEAVVMSFSDRTDMRTGSFPGTYKLMVGTFHFAMWTGPRWPNQSSTPFAANHSHWDVTADCTSGCLYNLTADPTEHVDIASKHPEIVATLRKQLDTANATVFSPNRGQPDTKLACSVALSHYHGFWGPFLNLSQGVEDLNIAMDGSMHAWWHAPGRTQTRRQPST
eukprot:m.100915 g.100915  ORF g.100915 m.100915 type:complete len:619 (+) comp10367_c0_seq1:74-1930(+)